MLKYQKIILSMIFGQQVYTMNGPCEADGTIQS